jgi:hypothetical protein
LASQARHEMEAPAVGTAEAERGQEKTETTEETFNRGFAGWIPDEKGEQRGMASLFPDAMTDEAALPSARPREHPRSVGDRLGRTAE